MIDPAKPVRNWSLDERGHQRVTALAASDGLSGTRHVISSAETKALETAAPLAEALGCELVIREAMHENDRDATGYLPPDEFETVADQFFARPEESVRGWETAKAAQARIVREVRDCLEAYTRGDVLFVGHGGVGTLLFCHLSEVPISRNFDQGPGGGGCYFEFAAPHGKPIANWQPLENLIRKALDKLA
jgi:broad specificity phosphatase PhoE